MKREGLYDGCLEALPVVIASNTGIGIAVAGLMLSFGMQPWVALWELFVGNQIFAHVIGTTAAFVIPPVSMRLSRLEPLPRWGLYVVVLAALGVAGALISSIAIAAIFPGSLSSAWEIFRRSAASAAFITVTIGIGIHVFEQMRKSLTRTTLEVRTTQLERERAEKLAAEAQLGALQARLQPHFLFNTINSVLALIRENPAAAETMLQRLSRLLRFALDSQSRPVIALEEEVRLVTDYLEIERTRFGDRLRFLIDVPRELLECEVPPCSLQTLAENSVKYAVSPRREGGQIEIRALRYRDALVLEVRDDGPGFDRPAVRGGHGLDTLEKRMAALYGDEALLHIDREDGAVVRLRLPARSLVHA